MTHPTFSLTRTVAVLVSTGLLILASQLQAQHADIDFEFAGGKIVVEFGPEGQIFEGDFPTSGISQQETDDPGFNTEAPITPGTAVGLNIIGPLLYHDGTQFLAPPTGTSINVENALEDVLSVNDAFVFGSLFIAEANLAGNVHAHLDFSLAPFGLGASEYGAYGFLAELYTDADGIANSDSFYLIFNFGLSEPVFENAVDAFAAMIPEPGSLLLVAAGAGLLALRRRRVA